VVVGPEHVVVCCAASQALTVLWHVLRKRGGRRVAVEDPGWRWQRYTAEAAGLEAVPIRVDADGMVVSELAAADVDAVVMTPAHHYPTGVVMTAERRGALIAWARDRGALIVEDDYDVEYRFGRDPMASLQGLAPDSGTAPSGTSWSPSSASTSPGSGSAGPKPGCTCSPGSRTAPTSTRRRCGPGVPASACTSCTATAPRMRRLLRRCSSASRSRPSPS